MKYELELKKYLNKVYDKKIYDILVEESIDKLENLNLNELKSLINSKEVFLGSNLNEYIINLIPQGYDGYLLRKAISEQHNLTYPLLYSDKGDSLKYYTYNHFAVSLWEDFTNKCFIEDLDLEFNKESFNAYINENFDKMYDNIISKIKLFKNENTIVIPYDNKDLVNTFKKMLIENKLDYSYALSVVDIKKLRNHMANYSIDLNYYDEFDKLEDDLEECLNNFFKYNDEELFEFLINKENFTLIDNKLVKAI